MRVAELPENSIRDIANCDRGPTERTNQPSIYFPFTLLLYLFPPSSMIVRSYRNFISSSSALFIVILFLPLPPSSSQLPLASLLACSINFPLNILKPRMTMRFFHEFFLSFSLNQLQARNVLQVFSIVYPHYYILLVCVQLPPTKLNAFKCTYLHNLLLHI